MTSREFLALHQACDHSLERFHKESRQTMALLLLAAQSPSDATRHSVLQLQRDEEDRARLDYQQRRRELFGAVSEKYNR